MSLKFGILLSLVALLSVAAFGGVSAHGNHQVVQRAHRDPSAVFQRTPRGGILSARLFDEAPFELVQHAALLRASNRAASRELRRSVLDVVDHGYRPRPIFSGHFSRIIKASYPLNVSTPGDVTPDLNPIRFAMNDSKTVAVDWYWKQYVRLALGAGTHIDSPAHVYGPSVKTVDDYTEEELFAPLRVIDLSSQAALNPNYQAQTSDVLTHESLHGRIRPDSVVLFNFGWYSRYWNETAMRNMDASGVQHFPGISGDAALFLIGNRTIAGAGSDVLSTDAGTNFYFPAHYALANANCFGLENVDLSDETIPASGAWIDLAPLDVSDTAESPVRIRIWAQ